MNPPLPANLAAATAILVGGWLVARILAAVVRRCLKRTEVDNRLTAWIREGRGDALLIENMFGKAVLAGRRSGLRARP